MFTAYIAISDNMNPLASYPKLLPKGLLQCYFPLSVKNSLAQHPKLKMKTLNAVTSQGQIVLLL
jgi:hypothetical protein